VVVTWGGVEPWTADWLWHSNRILVVEEAVVVPVASSGETLGRVVMSEAAIRETIQKIDEVVESLERVIELMKLRQMKLEIKIARLKAEVRAKSKRPQGE